MKTLMAIAGSLLLASCAGGPIIGPPVVTTTSNSTTVTVPTSTQAQAVVGQIATDCGLIADVAAIASAIAGFPPGTAIATMAKQFCTLAGKAPASAKLGASGVRSVVFKGVRVGFAPAGTQAGNGLAAQNRYVILNGVNVPYR